MQRSDTIRVRQPCVFCKSERPDETEYLCKQAHTSGPLPCCVTCAVIENDDNPALEVVQNALRLSDDKGVCPLCTSGVAPTRVARVDDPGIGTKRIRVLGREESLGRGEYGSDDFEYHSDDSDFEGEDLPNKRHQSELHRSGESPATPLRRSGQTVSRGVVEAAALGGVPATSPRCVGQSISILPGREESQPQQQAGELSGEDTYVNVVPSSLCKCR